MYSSLSNFAAFPKSKSTLEKGFIVFLKTLESMSMPEKWDFTTDKQDKEILNNYIHYTFIQLQNQNKILTGEAVHTNQQKLPYSAFNTGLLSRDTGEELIAFFVKNNIPNMQPWVFIGCGTPTSRYSNIIREAFAGQIPAAADFICGNYDKLILNSNKPVILNYEHFFERKERLPSFMREMPLDTIKMNLTFALEIAIRQVKRNYRYAVPMYYVEERRLQLLLPFVLSFTEKAGFALIVDDKPNGTYFASTLLSFEMAYKNARLLTKPSEWLTL